jgi:hypothetical protein
MDDKKNRSGFDRRSVTERRVAYDLDYFTKGGKERRQWVDRRWRKEMRKGWIRVSKWSSVDLKSCNPKP